MKSIDLPARFWDKVEKTDRCWLWTAAIAPGGYGRFLWNRRVQLAHRLAYEAQFGPIPDGMHLHHECETPACVNPVHLRIVSPQEHVYIGDTLAVRNASKTHCPQGHPYDETNTGIYLGRERFCRVCKTARSRAERAKKALR